MAKEEEISDLSKKIDELRAEVEGIKRKLEDLSKTVYDMKDKERMKGALLRPIL